MDSTHLCNTCNKNFATCDGKPNFGNGFGKDNVYFCKQYEKDKEMTTTYEVTAVGKDSLNVMFINANDQKHAAIKANIQMKNTNGEDEDYEYEVKEPTNDVYSAPVALNTLFDSLDDVFSNDKFKTFGVTVVMDKDQSFTINVDDGLIDRTNTVEKDCVLCENGIATYIDEFETIDVHATNGADMINSVWFNGGLTNDYKKLWNSLFKAGLIQQAVLSTEFVSGSIHYEANTLDVDKAKIS